MQCLDSWICLKSKPQIDQDDQEGAKEMNSMGQNHKQSLHIQSIILDNPPALNLGDYKSVQQYTSIGMNNIVMPLHCKGSRLLRTDSVPVLLLPAKSISFWPNCNMERNYMHAISIIKLIMCIEVDWGKLLISSYPEQIVRHCQSGFSTETSNLKNMNSMLACLQYVPSLLQSYNAMLPSGCSI